MVPNKQNQIFEDDVSDEAKLIEKAQADPTAFAELYQRYLDRIYLYLRTRVASDEDAADLTQQVFLQALKALPGYRQRGLPFAAWLFQIARNAVTDSYRRQRTAVPWEAVNPRSLMLLEQICFRRSIGGRRGTQFTIQCIKTHKLRRLFFWQP